MIRCIINIMREYANKLDHNAEVMKDKVKKAKATYSITAYKDAYVGIRAEWNESNAKAKDSAMTRLDEVIKEMNRSVVDAVAKSTPSAVTLMTLDALDKAEAVSYEEFTAIEPTLDKSYITSFRLREIAKKNGYPERYDIPTLNEVQMIVGEIFNNVRMAISAYVGGGILVNAYETRVRMVESSYTRLYDEYVKFVEACGGTIPALVAHELEDYSQIKGEIINGETRLYSVYTGSDGKQKRDFVQ